SSLRGAGVPRAVVARRRLRDVIARGRCLRGRPAHRPRLRLQPLPGPRPPRGDSAIVREFNLPGIDFSGADTLETTPNGCREGDRLRRGDPMRLLMLALSLLCAVGCGISEEAAAAKDRESSKAAWALVLRVDGADVRIP